MASRSFGLCALLACALLVPAAACSSEPSADPDGECTPKQEVFCRCANRDEGVKVCGDDAKWGECEPCFGDGTSPTGTSTSRPRPPRDAGTGTRPKNCGDGTVNPGEACDDDNDVADDGCSLFCTPEGDVAATRTCPGLAVHVWDKPVEFTVSTIDPAANTFRVTPMCGGSTGSTAADRVYAITAHKTGTLKAVTSDATFNHMLYAGAQCAPGAISGALGCANAASNNDGETLSFPVAENDSFSLFVDGANANKSGTLTLSLTIE